MQSGEDYGCRAECCFAPAVRLRKRKCNSWRDNTQTKSSLLLILKKNLSHPHSLTKTWMLGLPHPTPCLQTSVMLILCQTEQTKPHPSLQFLPAVLKHRLLLSKITTTSNDCLSPMLNHQWDGLFFQSIHLQWVAASEQLPVQQFMTGRAPLHPH